jgi:hypothetical protein
MSWSLLTHTLLSGFRSIGKEHSVKNGPERILALPFDKLPALSSIDF